MKHAARNALTIILCNIQWALKHEEGDSEKRKALEACLPQVKRLRKLLGC